ncbi:type VII toxin-antitoxin system HepT family RNase toxin [Kyrpidia tusciae]|uniref:DUF86 domain-containing protein n=1 Tax=Kyrpidia tusciae (strain DSM 2912 / NBRC 15312 / T2) TaxID=562970 RepID=D5WTU8_KYRT2|nr:DUF86 domain-containing protein [Kyrpidia tusciae]ADG05268.1 protein of unknown function DUF86 [Kyrpidia tusciae DSM 2912]
MGSERQSFGKEVTELFLDRSWVRARLELMSSYAEGVKEVKGRGRSAFDSDPLIRMAAERSLHMSIECLIDGCNHIIDGYAMRDPVSYQDILQIMMEEGIFDRSFGESFLPVADLRRLLAKDYDRLTPEQVWDAVEKYADAFDEARRSLEKFLG